MTKFKRLTPPEIQRLKSRVEAVGVTKAARELGISHASAGRWAKNNYEPVKHKARRSGDGRFDMPWEEYIATKKAKSKV